MIIKNKLTLVILLLFFLPHSLFSFGEDNIYDDPGILRIYIQTPLLKTLSPTLKEGLENFPYLSAHKQQKILKKFHPIQDQLEQEYKNRKAGLANERLTKYGVSCIVSLAVPAFFIMALNTFLSEDNKVSFGALPFVVLQGSSFFFFKFLEVLSQKYIASCDGIIRDCETRYVRTKPLLGQQFCKVFETKLIAAHKSGANVYDYVKWFNAALCLPIAKKEVPGSYLNKPFENEFSTFPQPVKQEIRKLCLRHIAQTHTRVIAYFYGPPGTGKTRCARSIAQCLGLPFASIALANYSVPDLIGQSGTHLPHPGKFAEAILNAKHQNNGLCTNMVFLIDEVDKVLNAEDSNESIEGILSFLLAFLDPDTESYYNPYFETDIRIKDMLIILGGTQPLKKSNPRKTAMKKRLIKIKFQGFEKDYKKEYIVNQYVPQLYRETEKPYQLCIEDHFSAKDREELCHFIDEDEDPGLRSVQEKARKFVADKIVETYLNEGL